MISSRSRYANSAVSVVSSARGDLLTILPPDPAPKVFNFTYMLVTEGDRIDLMAHRIYGDDTLWWIIANANPEIMDWSNVPAGTVLRIPSAQ